MFTFSRIRESNVMQCVMFNLFDKTHFKCCFCVLHSLTFKALCVFVSHAWVCVFVHIWAIMCVQDHVMHIWHLYSVFSCMDRLIEAVRDVFLIKAMIKAADLGSRASTPQPLSQSYDSHCGQQAIAKSTAIRCTSAASYICLFLDMCVRLELQNEYVCHDHTKCPISRYNTYIYIYIYIFANDMK